MGSENTTKFGPIGVILAAARSGQLDVDGSETPAALLRIGSETIIGRNVRLLAEAGIRRFVVVTGAHQDRIHKHVGRIFPGVNVRFVFNTQYEATRDRESLLTASALIAESSFLAVDADTVFDARLLRKILEDPDRDIIVAAESAPSLDDRPRLDVDRSGRVTEVLAAGQEADGAFFYAGMERITKATASILLEEFSCAGRQIRLYGDLWQHAHRAVIRKGIHLQAMRVAPAELIRVTDSSDHLRAQERFG